MKKNKRASLYDPYLDTLGGGEKYILSVLKALSEKGTEIDVFWNKNLSYEIRARFSLNFKINWRPVEEISSSFRAWQALRHYDYFFYVTDGSYFASSAKKNFVYAMVPDKNLYRLDLVNKIKLHNYKFITHSNLTQTWLKKFGLKSEVILPCLDDKLLLGLSLKKERVILTVGRFFRHLHSKRQDVAIKTFKQLKKTSSLFEDYKLVLAGGFKKEDKSYFSELKKLAGSDKSIIFKTNVSISELHKFYKRASYYWHFAGYGVDEKKHPEAVEHLGITPLEAMASGCLTFCYSAGGPKETIDNGKTGFLFKNDKELIKKMGYLEINPNRKKAIMERAKKDTKKEYNYSVFKKKVLNSL